MASSEVNVLTDKKAVLLQGNRAMPQVLFIGVLQMNTVGVLQLPNFRRNIFV